MGFKYGKINERDEIVQRPDIFLLRGRRKILNELRKNAAAVNPMPVVYVDETYVLPHKYKDMFQDKPQSVACFSFFKVD
jgi:hypothetical protein